MYYNINSSKISPSNVYCVNKKNCLIFYVVRDKSVSNFVKTTFIHSCFHEPVMKQKGRKVVEVFIKESN